MSRLSAVFVSDFDWVYSDQGAGSEEDVTIHRPRPPPGYYRLGDYAQSNYRPGFAAVAVVREEDGSGLLARPLDYERVWSDKGSGGIYDGTVWRPVPPEGYEALGCVASSGEKPSTELIRCIRRDVLVTGEIGQRIYSNQGSKAAALALWAVSQQDHEGATAGTFLASSDLEDAPVGAAFVLPASAFLGGRTHRFSKKVLLVGIDGCRPGAVWEEMLDGRAPHLARLLEHGWYRGHALTEIPISAPGWASMFTAVWPEQHAVVDNEFGGGNPQVPQLQAYPHFFRRLKEARPNLLTASFGDLDFIRTQLSSNADLSEVVPLGQVADRAQAVISHTSALDVLFVHFDDVDEAGHEYGYDSPEYYGALSKVDGYIGQLLAAIHARPGAGDEEWLVIVSTDHGGKGHGHGKDSDKHIFILVSGPGAASSDEETPPPEIIDIPPTIATYLGISIQPGWRWLGEAVGLKAEGLHLQPRSA